MSEAFVFNDQQNDAMAKMGKWWNNASDTKNPFILMGYAGTGKTTCLRESLDRLGVPIERVALVTPTNRAAKVASEKSGIKAHTIHSLLFRTTAEEVDHYLEVLHAWEQAKSFMQCPGVKIVSDVNGGRKLAVMYTTEELIAMQKEAMSVYGFGS